MPYGCEVFNVIQYWWMFIRNTTVFIVLWDFCE